jgi:hypothetical protein
LIIIVIFISKEKRIFYSYISQELRISFRDISIILRDNQVSHGAVITKDNDNGNNTSVHAIFNVARDLLLSTYNIFYIGVEAQHGNLLYLNPRKIQQEEIFRRSHQI